jgi:hypothetical protein
MTPPPDAPRDFRRGAYALLIALAVGLTAGRILSAERLFEPSVHRPDDRPDVPRPAWPRSRPEPWPTFSSNDRSRWAAVRALVDEGTFVIGRRDRTVVLASGPAVLAAATPIQAAVLLQAGYQARVGSDRGIIFEDGFQSVDKVLHPERLEFYSTKPPLLTVLAAGEYYLLKKLFGWSIVAQRWEVIRTILFTFNVVPLVIYLVVLAWLAERFGATDWGRLYVVAAGGFATLVSPFLITFNNHTVAASSAIVAVWAVVRIAAGVGPGMFVLAGLAAGFTACNELPATALAAGLAVYLLVKAPARTLLYFAPAALLPVAALLAANYAQLGQLKPAYAEFGGPWYEYEGSHWRVPPGQVKRGIDFAGRNGETKAAYALHLLVGHHGVFSLTPIMLLAAAGMGMQTWRLVRKDPSPQPSPRSGEGEQDRSSGRPDNSAVFFSPSPLRGGGWGKGSLPGEGPAPTLDALLGLFTLLVSLVVIAFYVVKSDNYGGWSNGPRWLMWLTPLWLLATLPVLDRLAASRAGRALALVLLALSAMSMSYQQWNPWRHPWIYNWLESRGWIAY